jgi:ribosomal protein S18 acetylase RimI-like enzyme
MRIRLARPGDAPAIAAFNAAMALETEGKRLFPEVIGAGVRSLLKSPKAGFYLVAEAKAQIAGVLMITKEWSDWRNGAFWWIQSVYVLPEFRRRGIYRRLYRHVQQMARGDSRVCGFRLYVERENRRAQATYRALGMAKTRYLMFEELKPGVRFYR